MAFVAECSFCRLVFRGVPDDRLGSSTECPRCHNSFTLAAVANPEEVLARAAAAAPKTPAEGSAASPQTALVEANRAGAPAAAKRTGAKVAVPAPRALKEAPQAPAPGAPPSRFPNYPGLASFLLGCFAFLAGGVFHSGLLALTLGLLGLLLGAVGLVFAWLTDGRRVFPLVGLAVSLPALLLPIVWPGWLNLIPLGRPPRQTQRDGDAAVSLGGEGSRRRAPEGETLWVDASKDALHHDDVRLRVVSAVVGPAEFEAVQGRPPPRDRCLVITLRVTNADVARRLNYTGWGADLAQGRPVLRDHRGKSYPTKTFTAGWVVKGRAGPAAIPPGKSLDDVLVFEAPPADVTYLRLELPAGAVEAKGVLRMEIPKSMIAFR